MIPDRQNKSNLPLSRQLARLAQVHPGIRITELGTVHAMGDGICWVKGLPTAFMEEIITFGDGSEGVVFSLTPRNLGVVMLHQTPRFKAGDKAYSSGRYLSIGVGDELLGRVIDPLGKPLDGKPAPELTYERRMETLSPRVVERDFVSRPLYTGNTLLDTMVPMGRGQRQLLIGDNGLGKSALALDILINQRGQDVYCVYVMVGQKKSSVAQTLETLRQMGALKFTTLMVAEATALPGLKYLAPFAGTTVAEHWMWQGKDTLVVFDDLTTHSRAFREVSLLLRRPPGREAYPADIFYLHSRLLERATCLARQQGGGSMTALPIVETKQGELATYIPTNLISITDGQIYLDQRLFSAGYLPAIDVRRSVSRIGGKAQHPRIKEAAGKMKLDYLQFLELETFSRFGTRLEASVDQKINRGRVIREVLKQERLSPQPIEYQLAWMTALSQGLLNDLELRAVPEALTRLKVGLAATPMHLTDTPAAWNAAVRQWMANQDLPHDPATSA